jgi:hypothetical protein
LSLQVLACNNATRWIASSHCVAGVPKPTGRLSTTSPTKACSQKFGEVVETAVASH